MVRHQRDALQQLMKASLVECVERLTGRDVITFLSGMDSEGDASSEVFLLGPQVG
jgi:uncharacterized protein YbcI